MKLLQIALKFDKDSILGPWFGARIFRIRAIGITDTQRGRRRPSRYMKHFKEITPEEWQAMTAIQRSEFYSYWNKRGEVSVGCLACGYPTGDCAPACVACDNHPEIRYSLRPASPEFRNAAKGWFAPLGSHDET